MARVLSIRERGGYHEIASAPNGIDTVWATYISLAWASRAFAQRSSEFVAMHRVAAAAPAPAPATVGEVSK